MLELSHAWIVEINVVDSDDAAAAAAVVVAAVAADVIDDGISVGEAVGNEMDGVELSV